MAEEATTAPATETPEKKAEAPQAEERTPDVVTMRQLLECGVHFGHQTKRWNPKMKKYIFTSRNGIHVIDLQQTIKLIKKTYDIVRDTVADGGTILFVGTKKQAQDAIEAEAARCEMPYVHHRWLGGTLTNHITLRSSINKLKKYEKMNQDGTFDALSNKEASKKRKELTKLGYYLDGIKHMTKLPSLIFVVDTKREQLAVNEGNKLEIPIIGIVDTNADPTEVKHPIPANDDAIRAIKLMCSIIANAVQEGQKIKLSRPQEQAPAKPDAQKTANTRGGSEPKAAANSKAKPAPKPAAKSEAKPAAKPKAAAKTAEKTEAPAKASASGTAKPAKTANATDAKPAKPAAKKADDKADAEEKPKTTAKKAAPKTDDSKTDKKEQ